jgi:hypothetical protein
MDKLFVYVFASFNEPMYKKMVEIRIEQMRKRKIPFMFLINGPMDYSVDLREGEYTLDTSTFVKGGPHVVLHFQRFLQDLYSKSESEKYEYILKLNVSTFVNFEGYFELLDHLPKQKLIAGKVLNYKMYEDSSNGVFLSGTAMTFSKDVAKVFAYEIQIPDLSVIPWPNNSEDVIISQSLFKQFTDTDIQGEYLWIDYYKTIPAVNDFYSTINDTCVFNRHVFFRVRNDVNRSLLDPFFWACLYKKFG